MDGMRFHRIVKAALVAVAALMPASPAGAAGATVCRPNQLGTVTCPAVPRPKERPIYRRSPQALDRVRAREEVRDPMPPFVPSRETGRLGGATRTQQPLGAGPCRPDTLGNLRCR